jgi:hypothetical protein
VGVSLDRVEPVCDALLHCVRGWRSDACGYLVVEGAELVLDFGFGPAADSDLGTMLGQAFHEGCSLGDVTLAAKLPPDLVIAIGKRTIRRTKWLRRLEDDARNVDSGT